MRPIMRAKSWTSWVIRAAMVSFWMTALPTPALAGKVYNLTEGNAPPPAHKMYLSEEEFKSFFTERERPNAGYCKTPCCHEVVGTRENGRPFIRGEWNVDRKTGKVDMEYRVNDTVDKRWNPYFCHVTSFYRYAPPEKEQPSIRKDGTPARRLDLTMIGAVHGARKLEVIEKFKQSYAADRRKDVARSNTSYTYRYVEDMGFGLDRNDMFIYLKKDGKHCQVDIHLESGKDGLDARLCLMMVGGVVSQARAVSIARNSAAMIATKGFGVNAEVEKGKDEKDEAGFNDAWIADRLGPTPEQDHRVDRTPLGKSFYVACAYKLPDKATDVEITLWMIPGPDAIAASRERCQRVSDNSDQRLPLKSEAFRLMEMDVTHLADGKTEITGLASVRKLPDGGLVAYFTVRTADPMLPFIIGPGAWEAELLMRAYQPDPEKEGRLHRVELSKYRTAVTIADDPAFSAKILKPADVGNK